MTEITKQKAGKPDWTLLIGPLRNALEAMVRVREYGNEKYGRIAREAGVQFDAESWRDNPARDYLASAMRHMVAACAGERVNEQDGGCEHMAQAMIDLGFALEIERQGGPRKRSAAPSGERAYLWAEDGTRQTLLIRHPDDLPSLVDLVTIMARKRRWADHYSEAISLARHSIMVAKIVCKLDGDGRHGSAERAVRSALLHDASEVPYGDIPTPLKHLERAMLPEGVQHPNDVLTAAFNAALSKAHDLDLADPRIKKADAIAGCIEASARDISDEELSLWYDAETRHWASSLHFAPDLAYWTPMDDAARWWSMWTGVQP